MNNFSKHIDFEKRRMPGRAGLTVIELLVVIGIIAAVVAISLPAINAMQKSFDSTGAEGMISAALSTARTLAISRQQYVGVRFQTSYDPNDVLDEEQYMIFIIFDEEKTNWDCGFVSIPGYKPMKLPENIGVIDKIVKNKHVAGELKCNMGKYTEVSLNDFTDNANIVDTMTFSIVFSPAGKLVIHEVKCRNSDYSATSIKDDVFNTRTNVTATSPVGMFVDDYLTEEDGLSIDKSRTKLVIYNRKELEKYAPADRYEKYLKELPVLHINPYTGGIIEK